MRTLIPYIAALALTACQGVPTTQSVIARPMLDETTVGGFGYPVIVSGAEAVGLDPAGVASRLRFPARLGPGDFRAIPPGVRPPTHAVLALSPAGASVEGELSFVHGVKRIGLGRFTLPREAVGRGGLGDASATLILSMLLDAQEDRRDDREWED